MPTLLTGKLGLAIATVVCFFGSSVSAFIGTTVGDGPANVGLGALATVMAGLGAALLRAVLKTNRVGFELANEREREISRLRWEVSFWQAKAMNWPEPPPFQPPPERHV